LTFISEITASCNQDVSESRSFESSDCSQINETGNYCEADDYTRDLESSVSIPNNKEISSLLKFNSLSCLVKLAYKVGGFEHYDAYNALSTIPMFWAVFVKENLIQITFSGSWSDFIIFLIFSIAKILRYQRKRFICS
jgi:hypothetical protein